MKTIIEKGFLEKFAIIYLDRMKKLDYTKKESIKFFISQYNYNLKNEITNNIFDMIEKAKKLKQI
jgi:hypothetical protein